MSGWNDKSSWGTDHLLELQEAEREWQAFRLNVALASKMEALQTLEMPNLFGQSAAGEVIVATDGTVIALHGQAIACRTTWLGAPG